MITIAGRQLISSELVTISPLDRPLRSILFAVPLFIFTYYSLQFLRNLDKGVTIALPKTGFPILKVFSGKVKSSNKYKLTHYDNPYLTGLLGLLFFAAAEFFLVISFKTLDYTFLIN